MGFRRALIVVGLALGSIPGAAHASYLFTFAETGAGVTLTGSGSLNISGLSNPQTANDQGGGFVDPSLIAVEVGGLGSLDAYGVTFDSSQSFGTGDGGQADTGTGPIVGFFGVTSGAVIVHAGYSSGSIADSYSLFSGQTFASLGLTPGTYVYHYSYPPEVDFIARAAISESYLDTITVRVGTVPLPASAPLFGAALAVLGAAGYGLKRSPKAAA